MVKRILRLLNEALKNQEIYGSWCNVNLASAANTIMLQFQGLLLHLMNDWLVLHDFSTLHRWYGDPSLIYLLKYKPCSKYRVINFITIFHLALLLHSVNGTRGTHDYNMQCLQEHSIMYFCKILGGGGWSLLLVICAVMHTILLVSKETHSIYIAKNLLLSCLKYFQYNPRIVCANLISEKNILIQKVSLIITM